MENVKVKIIVKNVNNLLANATLSIRTVDYGIIDIKGFQIWKSKLINDRLQEPINIVPPSKPSFGKYIYLVFFENHDYWYEVERLIYTAYVDIRKQKNKDETINPEDVPF